MCLAVNRGAVPSADTFVDRGSDLLSVRANRSSATVAFEPVEPVDTGSVLAIPLVVSTAFQPSTPHHIERPRLVGRDALSLSEPVEWICKQAIIDECSYPANKDDVKEPAGSQHYLEEIIRRDRNENSRE